jgi:hypothetical protein
LHACLAIELSARVLAPDSEIIAGDNFEFPLAEGIDDARQLGREAIGSR